MPIPPRAAHALHKPPSSSSTVKNVWRKAAAAPTRPLFEGLSDSPRSRASRSLGDDSPVFRRPGKHREQENDVRHYAYVSDTKVEMLYAQIPEKQRARIITELKLDLKAVAVSVKDSPTEETRYSKLKVVDQYLRDHEEVGSIDNPRAYFAGTAMMKWCPFGREDIVYFGGATEQTVFGLGGSMKQVIGSGGDWVAAYSAAPALYAALRDEPEFSSDEGFRLTRSEPGHQLLGTGLCGPCRTTRREKRSA
jgi:hypothetical protein